MSENNTEEYKLLAARIRHHVLKMTHKARSSHVGSCFSMTDLLAVLYEKVLRVQPENPDWPDRDRMIISKGHAAAAVYAVLAERGFFPMEWLETFYTNDSHLSGHVTYDVPGVEASTGSLGHGFSIGCGMALAAKRDGRDYKTYVFLSDGECDEGSTWEAAMFAPHHQLDNLTAIVDYNKIQSIGKVSEVLDLEPFSEKWRSFGWAVHEIDGHDFDQIERALTGIPFESGKPSCIIAHTVKGKGVSFMENKVAWHYLPVNDEELQQALTELGVPD